MGETHGRGIWYNMHMNTQHLSRGINVLHLTLLSAQSDHMYKL